MRRRRIDLKRLSEIENNAINLSTLKKENTKEFMRLAEELGHKEIAEKILKKESSYGDVNHVISVMSKNNKLTTLISRSVRLSSVGETIDEEKLKMTDDNFNEHISSKESDLIEETLEEFGLTRNVLPHIPEYLTPGKLIMKLNFVRSLGFPKEEINSHLLESSNKRIEKIAINRGHVRDKIPMKFAKMEEIVKLKKEIREKKVVFTDEMTLSEIRDKIVSETDATDIAAMQVAVGIWNKRFFKRQ